MTDASHGSFEEEFPGLSESANTTVMSLVHTADAFVAMLDGALRPMRLSRSARQALAVLDGAGGPLSPTTIAERLIVTTASITSLLDTLEGRGLVERRPDPQDRRRLLVTITPEGRTIVDRFLPQVVALQTAVMANLSEPERQQLRDLVAKVNDGMASIDPDTVIRRTPLRRASKTT